MPRGPGVVRRNEKREKTATVIDVTAIPIASEVRLLIERLNRGR
jgi:hypothetical protein